MDENGDRDRGDLIIPAILACIAVVAWAVMVLSQPPI